MATRFQEYDLMSRAARITAIIVVIVLGFAIYNLYLAPPPSEASIRSLVTGDPMPGVANLSTGETLPTLDNSIEFDGIYPLPWGVAAVYHTERMHGDVLLKRGLFGWTTDRQSWGPIEVTTQPGPVYYWHSHIFDGVNVAERIMGRVKLPNVAAVVIVFDDGATLRQDTSGDHFAILSADHGGACELRVLDAANQVLQTTKLEPRAPPGHNPALYDCRH